MNIGIFTSIRSPYRKLQLEEFAKNKEYNISVYYTEENYIGRAWNVSNVVGVKESSLPRINIVKNKIYVSIGMIKAIKENDLIVLGGYEKITYMFLSILAKLYKKKSFLLYDGISPKRVNTSENKIKLRMKKIVVENSSAIFANGKSGKAYFVKKFNYPTHKIFNQFLTVDVEKIQDLSENREKLRKIYRDRLNIGNEKKVILYSGRLIKRKNVDKVITAIAELKNKDEIVFVVLGDGEENNHISTLSKDLKVCLRITGFIPDQEELFKHYFVGDVLILPSYNEPWGLVINEAMAASLPVIASDEVGASLDLVRNGENGYIVKAGNIEDLTDKIEKLLLHNIDNRFGRISKEIIKEWTFKASRNSFYSMVKSILD
ncbi:glycosyltransferase family 4 protein [Bacillus gobiensis]|uniref:glycosyltransferase family 4 protein n=1 Tax=Bacillus gobiensis TaxID=1441095 RepID=UPI003D24493A